MIIPTSQLMAFFFVFARAGALLSMIPVFGGRLIPSRVQLALAMGISILVFASVSPDFQVPSHFLAIVLSLGNEILIGMLMGFAVRMIFFTVEFAGSLIGSESGLTRSDLFDPMMETQGSPFSTVLFFLSAVLIVSTGVHYEIIRMFVFSYSKVPLGGAFPALKGVQALVRGSSEIFMLGLKIAAPVVALNFVLNMTFSVLGKAVPKMNVFMVSFSVRIVAGLSLLLLATGLIVQYVNGSIQMIPRRMIEFISF